MKHQHSIVRSALSISFATSISRVLGYIRDVLLAIVLGAGYGMDAFTIAFRVANLFRRLVAESSMNACFVPVFVHYQKDHSRQDLWDFARKFFYGFLLVLTTLTVLVIVFSPLLIRIMAPGFSETEGKLALTILLNRLMAPYLICIGLSAFFMGILNSMRVFLLPAMSPVYFNLAMIGATLFIAPHCKEPAVGISIGVLVGGILQWAMQIPALKKQGMSFKPTWHVSHPENGQVFRLFIPTIFGVSIVQINLVIDSFFGSFLQQGSVSSLYYADRIMELIIGIFVISLATVALPELSRAARDNDYTKGSETLTTVIRLVLFVSVPATVGLMVLSNEITLTLFRYGHFSLMDGIRTSQALFFFAIGLTFISVLKVIAPAFYAFKNTKTPVIGAALGLVSNIILNILLYRPLQVGGIALATSIAALINLIYLIWKLEKNYFKLPFKVIGLALVKIMIASLAMAGVIWGIIHLARFNPTGSILARAIPLLLAILAGLAVYVGMTILLKCREMEELKKLLKKPQPILDEPI